VSDQTRSTRIAQFERKLEELPLLPAVVAELLTLDPLAEDYFERLLGLAERDPPLAARVLRVANSPASAPRQPIIALRQAVTRLGAEACGELVLAMAVMRVFVPRSEAQRGLWLHALQTALAARRLCAYHGPWRMLAEPAYLCGLLHDIGRFVQFEAAPGDLSRVDDRHWASPRELLDVEQQALGYDHAELGYHACRKWNLPPLVAEMVRRHHDPAPVESGPAGLRDLLAAVQWADHLSVALLVDPALHQTPAAEFAATIEARHPTLAQRRIPVPATVWSAWVSELHAESLVKGRSLGVVRP
jgi:putative nucleotidyltransferase with HDIG domain